MIDLLLMLLSSDWFLPYWKELGLTVEGEQKSSIQRGSREILNQFIDKSASYVDADFRPQRLTETVDRFKELIQNMGANESVPLSELDWFGDPGDDLSTGIMLQTFTESFSKNAFPDVALDWHIRKAVEEVFADVDPEGSAVASPSFKIDTTWDRDLLGLFPEDPNALQNIAECAIRKRRLKLLWKRLSERLSKEERELLLDWYRRSCAKRGIPWEAIPSYII